MAWRRGRRRLHPVPLHNLARAESDAARRLLPGDHLHDARLRPDLRNDGWRADRQLERLLLYSYHTSFTEFRFGLGAAMGTFGAVMLATTAKTLAFALVFLRPMFRQVAIELEEASLVEGCNLFRTFYLVVLPLIKVPLIVVGALCFAQAYGQFVYPLTMLSEQELQPATAGIYSFVGAELRAGTWPWRSRRCSWCRSRSCSCFCRSRS